MISTAKRLCEMLDKDYISAIELSSMHNYYVWRCPICKRLYVFENEGGTKAKYVYKLDEE